LNCGRFYRESCSECGDIDWIGAYQAQQSGVILQAVLERICQRIECLRLEGRFPTVPEQRCGKRYIKKTRRVAGPYLPRDPHCQRPAIRKGMLRLMAARATHRSVETEAAIKEQPLPQGDSRGSLRVIRRRNHGR
jgi:hypothetical protein